MDNTPALLGGDKAVRTAPGDLFTWPIITAEDEAAVLEVLRRGGMSDTDVTEKFEEEFASWLGVRHALGFNNGTAALHAAMFGVGVGVGDEIICPAVTYWASALPAFSLGASVVFADIDPDTLCIDPNDIEDRITDRTKAIVVVHYLGQPAEMGRIMEIARLHGVAVIEDVSHAQGGRYHGRRLGTIGDVGAMSLMSGKAFAIGEAGMLVTDDQRIYERGIAFGHYERYGDGISEDQLRASAGMPLGGYKYRMHQLSSAVGRVQLRHYEDRIGQIDTAMNYFWDQLADVRGVRANRPDRGAGNTNGGWYSPHGFFISSELDGLSVSRFTQALVAEGVATQPGCNRPLHLHPLFNTVDVYGHGRPTAIANAHRSLPQQRGSLPAAEEAARRVYSVPWFKHYRPEMIDEYVAAFVKISERYEDLLAGDPGDPPDLGDWHLSQVV